MASEAASPVKREGTSGLMLPVLLLKNYLHYLSRRPISASNVHFKTGRIASLQSLAPLLLEADDPDVRRAARMLRTLTPESMTRLAPEIQRMIHPWKEQALPRWVVVTGDGPDDEFFRGIKNALMVLGQGIGIGDEIMTFPLAGCLRRRMDPEAHLHVLSSYRELWRDVEGVDSQGLYGGLLEVVETIRSGQYDMVAVVDFERPGLASAMCLEAGASRYVEMAMGSREMSALDGRRGWQVQLAQPKAYFTNLYHNMQRIRRWFGDYGTCTGLRREEGSAPTGDALDSVTRRGRDLTIYVSPFTSKEDPSERYWSQLLHGMLPDELGPGERVKLWIDSGANPATRAFAQSLAGTVQGLVYDGVICEPVASLGLGGSLLSLTDAMRRIEQADMVVTADSFPAHAGQLYGKLTFVLARDGVENWRSPARGNFYLRASAPLERIGAQLRMLLHDLTGVGNDLAQEAGKARCDADILTLANAAARLTDAIAAFDGEAATDAGAEAEQAWADCRACLMAALDGAAEWPAGQDALLIDHDYRELMPEVSAASLELAGYREHMACRWAECENSNLLKYAYWRRKAALCGAECGVQTETADSTPAKIQEPQLAAEGVTA
jgi:ADP-heptose:LPS heptosyltransferase